MLLVHKVINDVVQQVITVDGTIQALDKASGEKLWVSQLNLPMIGSLEFENQVPSEDAFVPLVDGSLIRFDKDGFLQRTQFNVKDQDLPNFFNKNQCIVTGQTKTTAIQIDLSNGKILQTVGAEFSSFQGFKHKSDKTDFQQENNQSSYKGQDPFWLVMKNYDYLSYDHQNGMTQWSIFYSLFSNTDDKQTTKKQQSSSELMNNYAQPPPLTGEQQIFAKGNLLYSLSLSDSGETTQNWSHISQTPIFQVLNINKITDDIQEVPINLYMEKEVNNIKLVFIDNFIYADHSYRYLPEHRPQAIEGGKSNTELATKNSVYQEWIVPIKEPPINKKDDDIKQIGQVVNEIVVKPELPLQPKENISTIDEKSDNQSIKNETVALQAPPYSFFSVVLRIEFIVLLATLGFIQWLIIKFKFGIDQQRANDEDQVSKNQIFQNESKEPLQEDIPPPAPPMQIIQEPKRKIQINEKAVLGLGSGGTVVYEGYLNGRVVAVKRMLLQHNKLASTEIQFLQKVDLHPNVITYYDNEEDKDFVYLAIEKCEGNLENLVELMKAARDTDVQEWKVLPLASIYMDNPKELKQPNAILSIMQQSLKGLKFLHDFNIVHRDIKPHNILLNKLKCVKLSDMGLSKQLHEDQISYHTEIKGSLGWQPPEVIHSEKEHQPLKTSLSKTFKVDIFSLGCVFYYILTYGEHPFGKRFEREKNIISGKYQLNHISKTLSQERIREAANLIEQMIQLDPKKRPNAEQLLMHIFFWSNDKKLKIIQDVSDKLEFQNDKNNDLIMKLETIGAKYQVLKASNNNWTSVLHNSLFIRNKKNHFRELPEEAKKFLGSTNDSYLKYFATLFPTMMLAVDEYVRRNLLKDPLFAQYYDSSIII